MRKRWVFAPAFFIQTSETRALSEHFERHRRLKIKDWAVMGILIWIGVGLCLAFLAIWTFPPRNMFDALITAFLTVFGAVFGGLINGGLEVGGTMLFVGPSFISAVVGGMSVLLLFLLGKSVLYLDH